MEHNIIYSIKIQQTGPRAIIGLGCKVQISFLLILPIFKSKTHQTEKCVSSRIKLDFNSCKNWLPPATHSQRCWTLAMRYCNSGGLWGEDEGSLGHRLFSQFSLRLQICVCSASECTKHLDADGGFSGGPVCWFTEWRDSDLLDLFSWLAGALSIVPGVWHCINTSLMRWWWEKILTYFPVITLAGEQTVLGICQGMASYLLHAQISPL